jgi:hypothetical protein
MKATKQHKTRFRKNLAQFAKLKDSGSFNGSAATIKEKLQAAAGSVNLDFDKEMKKITTTSRKNPKVKVESKEGTGTVYEPNRADTFWRGDSINVNFVAQPWHTDPKKAVEEFNLAGIEFGNWLSEKDRTEYLAKSMQGLHNLSKILKVKHAQIGLNGKLGIAFGARGRGGAVAHYEGNPKPVINLTKEKGQNSLAHEYGHSLDNALSSQSSQKWITGGRTTSRRIDDKRLKDDGLAGIAESIFKNLYYTKDGKKSNFYNRLSDGTEYERRRIEVFARCVDMYVSIKSKAKKKSTDHLSHGSKGGGVTPTIDEMGDVIKVFDSFFKKLYSQLKTRKNPEEKPSIGDSIKGKKIVGIQNIIHGPGFPNKKIVQRIALKGPRGGKYYGEVFSNGKISIENSDYGYFEGERVLDGTKRENPKTAPKKVKGRCEVTVRAKTNPQKDGIEIRFDGPPAEEILEPMKDVGFILYPTPKNKPPFWAAKHSEKTEEVAVSTAGKFDSALVNLKPKSKKQEAKSEKEEGRSKKHKAKFKLGDRVPTYGKIEHVELDGNEPLYYVSSPSGYTDSILNNKQIEKAIEYAKKKMAKEKKEEKSENDLTNEPLPGNVASKTKVDFKADGSIQEVGRYDVYEVENLQASHNKDCTPNSKHKISRSQPRDRSSEALCAQPTFIAENLNPASITQGNLAFAGAPVTMFNGQVIQGNGRTIALKIAYDEKPKSAKRYREYLIKHANDFGLAASTIKSYNQPVLVRTVDVSDKKAIELGNVVDTSQAKMSKIDQAKAYIRNLSENQLAIIGKLIQNSSGETIGAIIDDIGMDIIKQLKKLDRTGIVEKNKLTAEGKTFLRSVLVGLVFDGEAHPNALHHYMKLPHRIKAGLERSFGYIIPLIGNKGDITDTLARAVEVAAQTHGNEAMDSAADYTGSKDMFEAKNFTKQETALAQFLLDQSTQKAIRDAFGYYDELLKGTENLFAKTPPKPKKEAFRLAFIDRARPNPGTQMDEIIHQTIVRAQRLQNFEHDNSPELNKLDNLLGRDGWKWNAAKTQIIRLDNSEAWHKRLVLLQQFKQESENHTVENFTTWLNKNYPDTELDAKEIYFTIQPGAWRKSRENPARLTSEITRSVLDDFFSWIEHNPLMDYTPGANTFKTWIQYNYPGYEEFQDEIWDAARPAARENHGRKPKKISRGNYTYKGYKLIRSAFGNKWTIKNERGEKKGYNSTLKAAQHTIDHIIAKNLRENPTARFIYIGVCKQLTIDQGTPQPVTLQGPHAMLTNKAMKKLFIVPFKMMDNIDDEVADMTADEVFAKWHHYAPDNKNYKFNWPERQKSHPVGTAKEIYYMSDKVMRQADSKGDQNLYHHSFDAGKRPCLKKGNILIITDLEINENGILN